MLKSFGTGFNPVSRAVWNVSSELAKGGGPSAAGAGASGPSGTAALFLLGGIAVAAVAAGIIALNPVIGSLVVGALALGGGGTAVYQMQKHDKASKIEADAQQRETWQKNANGMESRLAGLNRQLAQYSQPGQSVPAGQIEQTRADIDRVQAGLDKILQRWDLDADASRARVAEMSALSEPFNAAAPVNGKKAKFLLDAQAPAAAQHKSTGPALPPPGG